MKRKAAFYILSVFIIFSSVYLLLPQEEAESYIVAGMERCSQGETQKSCFENLASDFLDRFSIPEILTVFDKHERDPAFFRKCHEEAHYLGREAYRRINSVAKIYEQSNETCLGGVFHGALEGYFIKKELIMGQAYLPQIKEAVSGICNEIEIETRRSFNQCHHGLGHALMFAAEDNLVDALSLCDALNSVPNRENCYTGAFMQNVNNGESVDHPTSMLREDEPLYPCTVLEEHHRPICYTYAVLERYQGDTEKGIELCGMIPEKLRTECFRTLGRNGAMHSSDPSKLKSACEKISQKEYREACFAATAGSLLVRYGFNSNLALDLCALIDESGKRSCYQEVGYLARSMVNDKEEAMEYCGAIENEIYRNICQESK